MRNTGRRRAIVVGAGIVGVCSAIELRRRGWEDRQYAEWSATQARAGTVLIVPTSWRGETCMRVCVIDPRTRLDRLVDLLEHMAED